MAGSFSASFYAFAATADVIIGDYRSRQDRIPVIDQL